MIYVCLEYILSTKIYIHARFGWTKINWIIQESFHFNYHFTSIIYSANSSEIVRYKQTKLYFVKTKVLRQVETWNTCRVYNKFREIWCHSKYLERFNVASPIRGIKNLYYTWQMIGAQFLVDIHLNSLHQEILTELWCLTLLNFILRTPCSTYFGASYRKVPYTIERHTEIILWKCAISLLQERYNTWIECTNIELAYNITLVCTEW